MGDDRPVPLTKGAAVGDLEFSPFDRAIHEDPFSVYTRLRAEAPIYHNPDLDFWALSRHADVTAALPDSALYSNAYGPTLDKEVWGSDAERVLSIVAMDPPRHTALRALINKWFTPRRVALLEDRIREIALGHLEPALERGAFDFATDFSGPLPLDVISEMIGVPDVDKAFVRNYGSTMMIRRAGEGVSDEQAQAGMTLIEYYSAFIAERRKGPLGDDLLSVLMTELGDGEIVAFLLLLIGAGSETTTHLLGSAWYWAWRFPDEREKAFSGRIKDWVEETLRYDSPAAGVARRLTADHELHGTKIPAGARMWLLLTSANRDERVFPDPDRFDLDRDTTAMVTFGVGRHYCVGSALGRLEAKVALEALVARVSSAYEIDPAGIRRLRSSNVRGFASLPTVVEARSL
ncbi:cytochrome P450 [Streptosporangiaceae bacterium NEAU-GS5]|nr:cytochrome P450 [Streptosporangiaceae bacterium NEAU-GS5]